MGINWRRWGIAGTRPRHLLIRLLTPLIWQFSEKRKFAALQEFSDTELDSGWQSLYTLDRVSSPATKAELFQHSLEEFYHARMFADLLASYSNAPLNRVAFARECILRKDNSPDALLEFLAQVYVGESEINEDFLVYAEANLDLPIRELFQRIKKDEEGHEEVSWAMMLGYAGADAGRLRRLIFRKRLAHAWKRYVSFTQVLGNFMLSVQLTLVYFLIGAPFVALFRRRLVLSRQEQLEILRRQLEQG